MHDADLDPDDDLDGVWMPAETIRALTGQPRHRPGLRPVWRGRDPFDAPTTNAAQYVARAIADLNRTNGA